MRVIVVGATGTIGNAIVDALGSRHDVVPIGHRAGAHRVDLADPGSVEAMYRSVGPADAVVSAAGLASFGPLTALTWEQFSLGLTNKLMGQVNLVRLGMSHLRDGGSFTLTSGILARHPVPGSSAISLVNAGLEAFARAAALEMPRSLRINVVSPPWVSETLTAMGRDPAGGLPAARVARAYVESVEGSANGATLEPK